MNKLTKKQKNELDIVYRRFANNEKETKQGVYASIIKFDFKGLYIALDATARKMNCENGSSYIIPMEDGNYFVQEFYNKYSTLDYYVDNKKARTIIDENASVNKEYEFLDFAKDLLSPTKLGIGQPQENLTKYQEKFINSHLDNRTKDRIIFDAAYNETEAEIISDTFSEKIISVDDFTNIKDDVLKIIDIIDEDYDNDYYNDGFDPADDD